MMVDPITVWFEIMEYNDKRVISIPNLVETIYPWPIGITYDQRSELIGHELIKSQIEG